ncbi:DUF2141 domain-containing protein [Roseospira navarrensis]|nr:DUF2141 domain-containing protein [Roseospira navarrensis]
MSTGCPGGRRRRPLRCAALLLSLAAVAPAVPVAAETPPAAAPLALTITNVSSAEGTVYVAVYDTPDAFLDADRKRLGAKAPAEAGTVRLLVEGLPPGRYAIAVFHDENGNGEFDTGLFGVPLEGFGFTRDPSVVPSLPDFEDAAISLEPPEAQATLRMRYTF